MSVDPKRKLDRFIDGILEGEDTQVPPGPDGDPQLAAFDQFLLGQKSRLGDEDAVLDVGSGLGVAAHRMHRVWKESETVPWYFALDFPEELEKLALPSRIHNRSQKFELDDLTGGVPSPQLDRVRLVILRNVLHHLHILATGETLSALRRLCQKGAEVYVQDMEFLPSGERINIGWAPDILESLFFELGFKCNGVMSQRSRSGTPWYTTTLSVNSASRILSSAEAADLVLQKRKEQLERRTIEFNALDDDQSNAAEYFCLLDELASLHSQIQSYTNGKRIHSAMVCGIPLQTNDDSALDYFEEFGGSGSSSGLKAILSSKRLIDLRSLISGATDRLWFMGYSQRILFTNDEIRSQLKLAVERGVSVRLLLAKPESAAVAARSKATAYAGRDLSEEVVETIDGFWTLRDEIAQAGVSNDLLEGFEIGLGESQISSSFFVVDQTCIASIYSTNMTGGDGAALILQAGEMNKIGYYQALVREFQGTWVSSHKMEPRRDDN